MAGKKSPTLAARLPKSLVLRFQARRKLAVFEREALFILAAGASIYFWLALASHHPADPSTVNAVFPARAARNLAGHLGALVSGTAMLWLGLVAWLLPLPFLTASLDSMRTSEPVRSVSRLPGWLLTCAALATGLAMIRPEVVIRGGNLLSGGIVGQVFSALATRWFGRPGSVVLVCTALASGSMLIFKASWLGWVPTALARAKTTLKPARLLSAIGDCVRRTKGALGEIANPASRAVARSSGAPAPTADQTPEFKIDRTAVDRSESDGGLPMATIEPAAMDSLTEPLFLGTSDPKGAISSQEPRDPVSRSQPHPIAYTPPPLSVFSATPANATAVNTREIEAIAALLVKTFADFDVQGKIVGYQPGPVVTVYEFEPDAGVKQSKIVSLIDDVALALKVDSIFIHPVRGKRALGVQVPNTKREAVHLGDVLASRDFSDSASPLTFGLGKSISGQPLCTDLTTMPHLLVAGATGSGKSVCINALLSSVIMKASPADVRMILVDPKMLELSIYEGIPHLLMPVITEPAKASLALKWAAAEMERRYRIMQVACVRNISGFNDQWGRASAARREELRAAVQDDTLDRLPYILLVIDELADLMMTAPKDVESSIQRLAQKARASGIHLVLATQRPSVDIITGVIKANLPCRIAFQVVSKHDSRTILDLIGAEKLLGKGDMLFQRPGTGRLERLQGALITDDEVLNLVAAAKKDGEAQYDETIISWIDEEYARQKDAGDAGADNPGTMDDDPRYDEALALGRAQGCVSASFLQRHLKIGYNRAARMVEFMEKQGLVAKADGAKPRKWLGNTDRAF